MTRMANSHFAARPPRSLSQAVSRAPFEASRTATESQPVAIYPGLRPVSFFNAPAFVHAAAWDKLRLGRIPVPGKWRRRACARSRPATIKRSVITNREERARALAANLLSFGSYAFPRSHWANRDNKTDKNGGQRLSLKEATLTSSCWKSSRTSRFFTSPRQRPRTRVMSIA